MILKYLKTYESFTHNKRCYILLVGLPASGKSTYIRRVLSKELNNNYFVLEPDAIMKGVARNHGLQYEDFFILPPPDAQIGDKNIEYGEVVQSPKWMYWTPLSYSKVLEINLEAQEVLKYKIMDAVNNTNKSIVIDVVNMRKKDRELNLAYIKDKWDEFEKIAIVFNKGGRKIKSLLIDVAKRRDQELRKKGQTKVIPDFVFDDMIGSYEKPSKDEGFDEIRYVDTSGILKKILNNEL